MVAASVSINPFDSEQQSTYPPFVPPKEIASLYPPNWPGLPFHPGEVALQKHYGAHNDVMSYAPSFIRPFIPDQHRQFYENQPFMVAAARDGQGQMWATLLMNYSHEPKTAGGSTNLLCTSPDPFRLVFDTQIPQTDALHGGFRPGDDMGLLGIEFATRRRNRVNGRVEAYKKDGQLVFRVDQAFGNCPQYITPRQWWTVKTGANMDGIRTGAAVASDRFASELSSAQIHQIQQAETIFVATGYRGAGEDPRYGNDAGHRGGPAGFVQVLDSRTLLLPEFAGNNHYNSLGNLQLDDRMGVTIPRFEHGGALQLSGHGVVDLDPIAAAKVFPGALSVVRFEITQVNVIPDGTFPVRWTAAARQMELAVMDKVRESENVMSFLLQPTRGEGTGSSSIPSFQGGQYLPITLKTPRGIFLRTYSLSNYPAAGQGKGHQDRPFYRITVKREPYGLVSRWLHDQLVVGDVVLASPPTGEFTLTRDPDKKYTVLISTGIGITPVLSMLHQLTAESLPRRKNVIWIHGARNSDQDAMRDEVNELVKGSLRQNGVAVKAYHVYSQPQVNLGGERYHYDRSGHINAAMVQDWVPDVRDAEFYICGGSHFAGNLQDGLRELGVSEQFIHMESF